MANKKHQGRPVSEASRQDLQRERLLWALEELRQNAEMVKGIASDAMKWGDDLTKEAAISVHAVCNQLLDSVERYRKKLDE